MLEHLFGSKTRVKLLRVFLSSTGSSFYVRELARKIDAQIHAVRRELENLERLGIICSGAPEESAESEPRTRMRRYYRVDPDFFLMNELRSLILKSQFLLEHEFKRRVARLGSIRYFALLGFFVGTTDASVDVLVVGRVDRRSLTRLMTQFERELGRTVNYSVMTEREFQYRKTVGDRFLYGILESKKIIVIDELAPASPIPVAVERVA